MRAKVGWMLDQVRHDVPLTPGRSQAGGSVSSSYVIADGVFALCFQDGKHIVVLVEGAVSGRDPLKCIDLAAPLHVETHGVFNIELTLKAGALLENVEVQAACSSWRLPSHSQAISLSLAPKYDKKIVLHDCNAVKAPQDLP